MLQPRQTDRPVHQQSSRETFSCTKCVRCPRTPNSHRCAEHSHRPSVNERDFQICDSIQRPFIEPCLRSREDHSSAAQFGHRRILFPQKVGKSWCEYIAIHASARHIH
uniref:(northern house mosquito) hypothetical protein n=1 Tax=Culex pipiens TaxID=7175 RepID=A0A8D8B5Z5_CULPI